MRTLTDEEKERLMDEVIKSIKDRHTKYAYEKTVSEFAAETGMSIGFAKRYLHDAVEDGKMTKRSVIMDGKTFVVYSMI